MSGGYGIGGMFCYMHVHVHVVEHRNCSTCIHVSYIHVYMFLNERCEGRKKEASKLKQTNKAKQHSTPKAVTFPRKNELPQVGLEPTTLYTLDRALYHQGSSAGWAQISYLMYMYMSGYRTGGVFYYVYMYMYTCS